MTRLFVGGPICYFIDCISHVPAFIVLYWMVKMPFHYDFAGGTYSDLMQWLCDLRRIPFFIGIRVARALVAPFVRMFFSILVKWFIIGKFKAGPRDTTSEWELLRHWLSTTLFSREKLQDCTEILGRHYELVSILYRMLGAKVGKRVFWPGHQPVFTGEFDLLEIGDDCVFGSRSGFFCCTVDSCEKVILCAGSNLSDNSYMMPGSVLGKNAVLGSNSVCPEGWYLPEGSVWFGSKGGEPVLLERGVEGNFNVPVLACNVKPASLQMQGDATTLRPFGRAFYLKDADYDVFPLGFIIAFTVACKTLSATVHTLPLLGAIHGAAWVFYGFPISEREYSGVQISTRVVYITLLSCFYVTHLMRVMVWLGIEFFAKWTMMGRRKPGRYDYDVSDYCQRWELYQVLTRVRNFGRMNLMEFIGGTEFICIFFRLLGCKIGKGVCLYPAGGDPYMPEPDLVEIGDYCAVDVASIVCHLNTGGHFELAKITMEDRCTLRTRSRIQQGVHMESGSMLLEKSLAMTGEIVDGDTVWQGTPASRLFSYHSLESRPIASYQNSAVREYEATTISRRELV
jgi:carbonic anhydrase/acetyltransferase-like protein (isoleucine patch superfamily)